MRNLRSHRNAAWKCLTCLSFLVALVGCEKPPPVVTYVIPTNAPDELAAETSRLIAAMVPRSGDVWIFKLLGPDSAVTLAEPDLKSFVQNIQFEDQQPKLNDLPDSWRISNSQSQFRFASINIDTPEKQLDLSVSKFGSQADWDAMVSANVNRWRGQVGLQPSDAVWAGAQTLEVAAADQQAVWVDVSGVASSGPVSMTGGAPRPVNQRSISSDVLDDVPPASPPASVPPTSVPPGSDRASQQTSQMQPDPRLKFDRPDGWRDGQMKIMRMAAFEVGPPNRPAELTVITAGGDLTDNVARWLGEVRGEPPAPDAVDAAMDAATVVSVDGRDGKRFILGGQQQGGDTGIDVTVVPLPDGMSLFIKLVGPVETLTEQSQKVGEFLASLQMDW